MIFILIKDLYWILLSMAIGAAIIDLGKKLLNYNTVNADLNAPLASILGLSGLSFVPVLLNFFIPIGLWANVTALVLALISAIWAKKTFIALYHNWKDLIGNNKLVSTIVVLLVCALASRQSIWIDEGVYHAQYIKWLETFKIVPGLGNIQHRFAFNSHWHVLASLLNGSFITGQESNHINSLMYLLGFATFMSHIGKQGYSKFVSLGFMLAMNLPFVMCYHIAAPSADYALMVMGWIIILLAIEKWRTDSFWDMDLKAWTMLVIAAFAITIKVSAAPMAALPAIIWLRAIVLHGRWKLLLVSAILCLLFWVPWAGRNYILSGSLVFPVKVTALDPVWAIGEPLYNDALEFIVEGGYTLYKPGNVKVLQHDPLPTKLSKWFFHNIRLYDRIIILGAVLLPLLLISIRKKLQRPGIMFTIIGSAYLGLIYWLLTAPDPRFGLGYLVPLGLLGAVPFMEVLANKYPKVDQWSKPASLLAIGLFWCLTFVFYQHLYKQFTNDGRVAASNSNTHGLLMPYPYPTVHIEGADGYNYATNEHTCWDAPLPCLEYPDSNIIMLGEHIQDGFAYKYPATAE